MTLTAIHSFISTKSDSPVAQANGEVLPSHWNSEHLVSGTIGEYQFTGTGDITSANLSDRFSEVIHAKRRNVVADGTTPIGTPLQTLFSGVTAGQTVYFGPGTYKLDKPVLLTVSNVTLIFDNCTFNIADTGGNTTMLNGASGPAGFNFQAANFLTIVGSPKLIGQGTLGTTRLAGMIFEKCDFTRMSGTIYYEKMAAGRFVQWCDHGVFGEIQAYQMNGQQTFGGAVTAGTAQVVVGCRHSRFGAITSKETYKPVLYLSVATDHLAQKIDNYDCYFGPCIGTSASGSLESCAVAIRSGVNCMFEQAGGDGFSKMLYIVRYTGDTGFSVDGNMIETVSGTVPSTAASLDALVTVDADAGLSIGTNYIGMVHGSCAGEYSIYCSRGTTHISSLRLSGAAGRHFGIIDEGVLTFDNAVVSGQTNEAMLIFQGGTVTFGTLDIRTGPIAVTTAAIKYDSASGSGGKKKWSFGNITYVQGGSANNYQRIVLDASNGFESTDIYNIEGTGSSSQTIFGSDAYSVKKGRMIGAVPTTQAYSVGSQVWRSAPAAAGPPGDVCVTAGTPGTWKAMANLAA
jgi:hypothetical protein